VSVCVCMSARAHTHTHTINPQAIVGPVAVNVYAIGLYVDAGAAKSSSASDVSAAAKVCLYCSIYIGSFMTVLYYRCVKVCLYYFHKITNKTLYLVVGKAPLGGHFLLDWGAKEEV
jgi:hypothetical protein